MSDYISDRNIMINEAIAYYSTPPNHFRECEIMKNLVKIIEDQEKENHWISVKDRLPKEGQLVIAAGIPSGGSKYTSIETRYSERVGFIKNITYWIPMPEDV